LPQKYYQLPRKYRAEKSCAVGGGLHVPASLRKSGGRKGPQMDDEGAEKTPGSFSTQPVK